MRPRRNTYLQVAQQTRAHIDEVLPAVAHQRIEEMPQETVPIHQVE